MDQKVEDRRDAAPTIEASAELKRWRSRAEARNATPDIVPGVPVDLSHSVDDYGSLVTVGAADWLIAFVPGLQKQWWHRFVHATHKHVFALRPLDSGEWLLVESWWTRLWVTVLPSADAVKFLRWGATGDIVRMREAIPGEGNQLRGWSNCAVLAAFVLGRKSKSWTPHGLYLELVHDGAKPELVEDLLTDHFKRLVDQRTAEALRVDADGNETLAEMLTSLGRNISAAILSPALLRIAFTTIVEAERYPRASKAYHRHGLQKALDTLEQVMARAVARGEARIDDPRLAAGQFMAMLRGNAHLEAALEVRPAPSIQEIETRVRSVVAIFLRGVAPAAQA